MQTVCRSWQNQFVRQWRDCVSLLRALSSSWAEEGEGKYPVFVWNAPVYPLRTVVGGRCNLTSVWIWMFCLGGGSWRSGQPCALAEPVVFPSTTTGWCEDRHHFSILSERKTSLKMCSSTRKRPPERQCLTLWLFLLREDGLCPCLLSFSTLNLRQRLWRKLRLKRSSLVGIVEPVLAHKEHLPASLEPFPSHETVTKCTFPVMESAPDSHHSLFNARIGALKRISRPWHWAAVESSAWCD